MKFIIVIFVALFTFSANAQETVADTLRTVIDKPTVQPEFPSGIDTFYAYVSTALSRNRVYVPGRVNVTFVIEKDGKLTNVEVTGVNDKKMKETIIKVFRASPKWKPGLINGEPVRAQYNLPLIFNP